MKDNSKLLKPDINRSNSEKTVNSIIRLSTSHPFITIAVIILITIAIIPGFFFIEEDNNIRGFLGKESNAMIETNFVENMFHISKSSFLITVESDNIYTTETLEYVKLLHNQFSADLDDINSVTTIDGDEYHSDDYNFKSIIENSTDEISKITIEGIIHNKTKAITKSMIKEVNSVINAEDATSDRNSLESFNFIEEVYDPFSKSYTRIIPKTPAQLNKLKKLLEKNKSFEGVYYSDKINGKGNPSAWILTVEIDNNYHENHDEIIEYIEETIDKTSHYGFETMMFGVGYINQSIREESRRNLLIQVPLIVLAIMIVFFLNFRNGIGVLVPEIITVLSIIWVYGLIGYFGVKLSLIGYLILPVLFAVTSSYSIHSLNQYYKEVSPNKNDNSTNNENNNKESSKIKGKKIADSMSHIFTTIIIAGLTTFVSLISLIGNNIIHIKTFGIFAGLGVIISVVLSLILIPALLIVFPQKKTAKKFIGFADFNNTLMDKIINKTTTFIIKYKYPVMIIFIVLVIASISGIFFINNNTSFVLMFNPDHKIRQLSKHFSEHTGGVTNMMVTIDTAPELETSIKNNIGKQNQDSETIEDDIPDEHTYEDPFVNDETSTVEDPFDTDSSPPIDDPLADENSSQGTLDYFEMFGEEDEELSTRETDDKKFNNIINSNFLKEVEELSEYIKTLDNVGRVYSYVDTIKHLHYIYNGSSDRDMYERIPDNDKQIENYKDILQGKDENDDGIIDRIESLVEPTYNKINIIITLVDKGNIPIDSGDYARINDRIKKHIDENFKNHKIDYYITSWSILQMNVQDEIVNGQMTGIIFSFLVIFAIISLLFHSPMVGLISIIPLSSSILVTMGIMGITGIPLDIATALISAIAIGIAVDDTIYYMLHLRKFKRELGLDVEIETLIYKTTKFTSKAIIFTSLALIFGFLIVIFSSFVPVRQFAILTALTLFVATVATLWGMPSIFLVFPQLVGVKKKSAKGSKPATNHPKNEPVKNPLLTS